MIDFILSYEDLKEGKIWAVKLVYLSSLVETNIEARRLISQGCVFINEKRLMDINEEVEITNGMILAVGKFHTCKINLLNKENE